ncbi:MAG: hypothetical protein K6E27_01165 [Eubacterium sp.]|nr:hypothetical protein [Eubacterium sp.]
MDKNKCRVIKINKDALFEFIYESFIAQEMDMLDINDRVGISNNFAIDWENGEFIFTAYNSEDENGYDISFPTDIDIQKLLTIIPATTDSVLSPGICYKDYSFEELREMTKKGIMKQ